MKNTTMKMKTQNWLDRFNRQPHRLRLNLFVSALLCVWAFGPTATAQTYSVTNLFIEAAGNGAMKASSTAARGMAADAVSNLVYVAANASPYLSAFNGTNGTYLGDFSTTGVAGGTFLIDQVGVADDGVIYAVNLSTASTSANKIYRWNIWTATPTVCFNGNALNDGGSLSYTSGRIGDTFDVAGSGAGTMLLAGVGGKPYFTLFYTSDGLNFTNTIINVASGFTAGGNIFGICFYTNNTFLVKSASASVSTIYLIQFPANFAGQAVVTGTVLATTTLGSSFNNTTMLDYSPAGGFLAAAQTSGNPSPTALFNGTNLAGGVTLFVNTNLATAYAGGNASGAVALGGPGRTNILYEYTTGNSLYGFQIVTLPPQPPSISTAPAGISGGFPTYNLSVTANGNVPLAFQWLASNSVSSTFTNIPGANTNVYAITTALTNFYEVIITNSIGSVTSTPVRVALLTPVTSTVVTQLWRVAAGSAGYSYLSASDGATRGLGYDTNSQRLVVANNSGAIYLLDAATGTNLGTMTMTGVSGGTFPIDQVVVADDGAVYGGNLVTSGSQLFQLYRWSAPTNTVTASVAYSDGGTLQSTGDRWGDTMAVRGSGADTQILLASRNGTNVALLTTADGLNFSASVIPVSGVPNGFSGLGIAFGDGNTFWSKTTGGGLFKIAFDPVALTASVVFDYTTPGQIPSSMVGVGVDPENGILAGIVITDVPHDLQLFQLTGTPDAPVLFDQAFFASANSNPNGSAAIAMKFPNVFALDANNGLIALTYGMPPTTKPTVNTPPASQTIYTNVPSVTFGASVSGSLPLYYQWQFGLATNDASFGNLASGTNSTLTLIHPPLSAAGYYRVVVHNIAGYATSEPPALLTLIVPTTSAVVTQLWTLPAGSFSFLDGTTYNTRGLACDTNSGTVLVADNASIHLLAATNGSYLGDLNAAGVFNGGYNGWLFDQIGVASDGTLYAGNLTLTGPGFSIVTWSAGYGPGSAASGYAYGGGAGGDPGSGSGDRWGDTMSVRGSGTSTEILLGSYSGTNVVLFTTTDGSTFTPMLIPVAGVPAGFSGQGIAFGADNTFWAKSPGYNLRQIAFDPTGATPASVLNAFTAGSQFPSAFDGIDVDADANILGGVNFSDAPNDLQLFLLSGNTNPPSLFEQAFFGSSNANAQQNAVTTLKGGLGFSLDVNNGLTAVSYGAPAAPPVLLTSVAYAPGAVTLNWNNTFNNHRYQVQFKNDLLDPAWTNLGAPVTTTNGVASYTDTTTSPGGTRFYRVISQ